MIAKRVVPSIVLLFTLLGGWASAAVPPWEIDGLLQKEAPPLDVVDLQGVRHTMRGLRGKVVVINFWASWCPPCREEMPSLTRMYNTLKGKGVVLLAVSIDEDRNALEGFLRKTPLNFPVVHDSNGRWAAAYKVYTYPTTFIIDRYGVVRRYLLGSQEWDSGALLEELGRLLDADNSPKNGDTQR